MEEIDTNCRCSTIWPVCDGCKMINVPRGCEACSCPEVYCLRDGRFEDIIRILTDYNCIEESYKQVNELFEDGCVDEYNHGYNTSRTYLSYNDIEIKIYVVFTESKIIGIKWHNETYNGKVIQYEIQFLGPVIANLGGTFREKIIRIIFPPSNFEDAYDTYLKIKQCM